jgi:ubiquinone biosynthesis protein UbiJ
MLREKTKELVDDRIDRVRDDDDAGLADDVAELQQAVAMLNAKLDTLVAASRKPPAKPGA